jgi:hypothetical protein
VFCTRMTARVNTMRERWWPGPGPADLPDMAARLGDCPAAEEFSTVHTIDDQYSRRSRDDGGTLPIRNSRTVQQVADAYQFPLSDLLAVGPPMPWGADDPLPPGTRLAIPDPGMLPLIAARIAGAALAAGMGSELDWATVAATIRRVTPIAAGDPSAALATTLARLLLATPVTDHSILARLKDQAPSAQAQG